MAVRSHVLQLRIAPVCVWVAVLAMAGTLRSQSPSPDPHWGASVFPSAHQELRATMSFNRFTVFSKTGNPGDPSSPTFNEVRETSGFNVGSLSYTDELVSSGGGLWTFTFNAGGGWSSDQPTKFFQNDYVHELLGQLPVPVGLTRSSTELTLAAQANHWWGSEGLWPEESEPSATGLRWSAFLGAGSVTGTLYHEPFLHGGGSLFLRELDLRFNAVHRISFPIPSDAYTEVADFGNLSQVSVVYVPSDFYEPRDRQWFPSLFQWKNLLPWRLPGALHDALGRPEVGLHVSYDSGLFVDRADNPISTWFAGLSFQWATGLRFETWNDIANGTDWGPTYGFLVSIDVLTFNPFGVFD